MFCPKCGTGIPEGGGFCPKCGTPVTKNLAVGNGNSKDSQEFSSVNPDPVKPSLIKNWKFWVMLSSVVVAALAVTVLVVFLINRNKQEEPATNTQSVAQVTESEKPAETATPTPSPTPTPDPNAVDPAEQEQIFKDYFENNVQEELGLLPNNLKGTFGSLYHSDDDYDPDMYDFTEDMRSKLEWNGTETGVITADILDMDADGELEMLVFFTKENEDYDSYNYASGAILYFYRIYALHNKVPKKISENPVAIDYEGKGELGNQVYIDEQDIDGTSWKSSVEIYKKEYQGKPHIILHIKADYDSTLSPWEDDYGYAYGFSIATTDTTSLNKEAVAVLEYRDKKLVQVKAESEVFEYWYDTHTSTGDNAKAESDAIEGEEPKARIYPLYQMSEQFASEHERDQMSNSERKKAEKAPAEFKESRKGKQKVAKDKYWSDYGFQWIQNSGEEGYYEFDAELIGSSSILCDEWLQAVHTYGLWMEDGTVADVSWDIVDKSFTQELR